jgi:FKBP-type peptidyl-prolyl cis-trans isomerase
MKQGAKWQLFIPPALAYGDRGPLAGQLLIFDVELLDVKSGADAK